MIVQDVMQAYKRQIQKDVNVKYNRDIQWLLVQLGAVLYSIQKQQQTARR
jgi:ribosomal silencing factor RsfS